MKLARLESTTRPPSPEATERALAAAGIRRVETTEGVEGDRERSLSQELAMADPRAIGEFQGGERLRQEAHALASRIAELGEHADVLLQQKILGEHLPHLDDSA